MNNCPKCGNPLQIGTTLCPICGTNTSPAVASVPTPAVSPTKSETPAVAQQTQVPTAVKTETPQNLETQNLQPAVQPQNNIQTAQPVTQVQPTQTVAQVQPVQSTQQAAQVQPVQTAQPKVSENVQSTQNVQTNNANIAVPEIKVEESAIAPTVAPIAPSSPVPSIPASLTASAPLEAPKVEEAKKKPKKKVNATVLIIAGIVLIVGIAALFLTSTGKPTLNQNNTGGGDTGLANTAISSNGYKLNIEDGWIVNEDGTNVIITNSNDTVAIKLNHTNVGLSNISKDTIESYLQNRTDLSETSISETTLSAKDVYLVNTSLNSAPIQIYYISGGTNLTIGVTVVYQTEESKTKYEASVTEMIGTLSYSDDSIKAISTMEMYSNAFNIFGNSINYTPTVEEPEEPSEPSDNEEQQEDTPTDENDGNLTE